MPITDFLRNNAINNPNFTCLIEVNPEPREDKPQTWKEFELIQPASYRGLRYEMTWGEFDAFSNKIANMLISNGIGRGNKVAILLMNCIEWLPIYFGILKTGAIAVPLNFRYTAEEIEHCLKLSETNILFFGEEFIGRINTIKDSISNVSRLIYVGGASPTFADANLEDAALFSSNDPMEPITDEDFAAIYFSSGTTGFPKAILHKHKSLMCAAKTEQSHHGQKSNDVFLCIPPLYHTGAKMHWFGSLMTGSKAVLLRGVKPDCIIDTISKEKVSIVWLLVPWAQDILDAIDNGSINLNNYNLDNWRLMHIGAQPVPPSLIKRWMRHFPHHDYDTNYGLSESIGPGCVHLGIENINKVGSIGIPGDGWQARIVDENGFDVECGEVGELIVKGDGVMTCYYNNEEATASCLKDGWLLTGDMAKKDNEGFIYLVDRKKDVIISGGENIYPVQIEDFLHTHNEIKDIAVIGLPDKRLGEIAAAIIELREGSLLKQSDIELFCEALPKYKRPHKIIFAKVPRNPTGKIEKPKLREMYCGKSIVEQQTQG